MARTACLVLSCLVSATNIHFKEQAIVAGTKPSIQADKAVRAGCFVAPATCACSLKCFLSTNIL